MDWTNLGGTTAPLFVPHSRSLRVLLVEDHPLVAATLTVLLRQKGHQVEVAASGEAALEVDPLCPPDVALVDISLPGIDGYEVARRFRRWAGWSAVVLAALTGLSDDDNRRQSEEAGFVSHLIKPVHFDELERVLDMARPPVARKA
jgi:CheY-like chemotaxis protein